MTDAAYTQYYFDRAVEIFGELENFDLIQPVDRLLAIDPPIYRVTNNSGWTHDGYQFTFKTGRGDVRDCQGHQAASGNGASPGPSAFLRGYWLKDKSADEDDSDNYQLERDLYMPIWPETSRIQFKADCLEREVGYAISRIRSV